MILQCNAEGSKVANHRLFVDFYNAMANQRCLGWNPCTHCFLSSAELYHARNFIKKKVSLCAHINSLKQNFVRS